jgi:hypothetical protein
MSLMDKTKEELAEIIESQLRDIEILEAEIEGMFRLLDDIKDSESIIEGSFRDIVPISAKDMTPEEIASFYDPIDE